MDRITVFSFLSFDYDTIYTPTLNISVIFASENIRVQKLHIGESCLFWHSIRDKQNLDTAYN